MTIWIVSEPRGIRNFCRDRNRPPHSPLTLWQRIHSITFAGVLGIVYIFVYLNHEEGPTFLRHTIFYTLCALENAAAALVWIYFAPANLGNVWFTNAIPTFCTAPLALSVLLMIVYYMYFHPKVKNEFYFQERPTAVSA